MDVYLWCRRGGEGWSGFNASALHERQQLVRDLGKDIFGQSSHAEHLVPGSVNVVPERHKLNQRYRDGSHEKWLSVFTTNKKKQKRKVRDKK